MSFLSWCIFISFEQTIFIIKFCKFIRRFTYSSPVEKDEFASSQIKVYAMSPLNIWDWPKYFSLATLALVCKSSAQSFKEVAIYMENKIWYKFHAAGWKTPLCRSC